jgi:restriction system protein
MKTKDCWMVRASDGELIELFDKGHVLIGWHELGDLSAFPTREALRERYKQIWPDDHEGKVSNAVSMMWKFCRQLQAGDKVLTYDKYHRQYLLGEITSDYRHLPKLAAEHPHERAVKWSHRISRDALKPSSRNSLGSTLTLFAVNEEVQEDLLTAANLPRTLRPSTEVEVSSDDAQEQFEFIKEETEEKAFELVKDKIAALSEKDVPRLVAAVLRAMGLKTKVSAPGSDRGVDVLASPDGLGLLEPRVKVEVKHRKQSPMGSQEIRSFLGGFRQGDRGLYVSTGGFSKDARYEADRAQYPLTLADLDDLTQMVLDNYDRFDAEGRSLINLVRIYWPN